jgi:N6-L-threonylcarbamoyladenine synthase
VRGQPSIDPATNKPTFRREGADLSEQEKADVAASFQRAAVGAVLLKVGRALDQWHNDPARPAPRSLIIGGGVSANSRLRHDLSDLARRRTLNIHLPPMDLCLDNAAMIAGLAFHRAQARSFDDLTLAASPAGVDAAS